jgi:DNA-binding GntR family transcriptional regulator
MKRTTWRSRTAAPLALEGSSSDSRSLAGSQKKNPPTGIARAERVADQVYRRLRQSILHGAIGPGARLRETEIAESLAVSRTPVREAISRLVGDRLVNELAAGGVEVVDTRAEMDDIYAIREALEVCAVGLAATRIDAAELEKLQNLLEAAEATSYLQYSRRAALNEDFHLTIAEAARSPRLAALIADFREFFLTSTWLSRQTEEDARKALQEHRAILKALQRGDRLAAEAALRGHLVRSYRVMGPGRNIEQPAKTSRAKTQKKGQT